MQALFDRNDYDGDCFIIGTEGEIEQLVPAHMIHIPHGLAVNGQGVYDDDALDLFFTAQVVALSAIQGDPELTHQSILRIAFLRMCVLRMGLYDYETDPVQHHCRYADYRILGNGATQNLALPGWVGQEIAQHLPDAYRHEVRTKVANMLCCVAYMFRVRAHHYLPEFSARYNALWRKCLYGEDDPGLDWRFISRHVAHAIYPDQLDAFWDHCVNTSQCSGTMRKRYNCAPAGIAGLSALRKGVDDLFMVFPRIRERNVQAIAHLEQLEQIIVQHRWAGSVNRRFYNAPGVVVDEARLAALAASVLGACAAFAQNSPLAGSQALQRLASNARITQGVIEQVLERAANADTMVLAVVPENQG